MVEGTPIGECRRPMRRAYSSANGKGLGTSSRSTVSLEVAPYAPRGIDLLHKDRVLLAHSVGPFVSGRLFPSRA
jgi:hypothetical protein